jgi:hypothetical protein
MLSKLITFSIVLIFFIIGLLTLITVSTNAKPLSFTLYNDLEWVIEYSDYYMKEQPTLTDGFNKDIARYCIELIDRVELNDTKIPYLGDEIEFVSEFNKDRVFSVAWYSDNTAWVVFRGSRNLQEWINNVKIEQLDFDTCKNKFGKVPTFMDQNRDIMVHSGFLIMYNELRQMLLEY